MMVLVFLLNLIYLQMEKYKIGIADDHVLFAEGMSNIIAKNEQLELCFIASTIPLLYEHLKVNTIDCLLLDVNLPPYNGLEVMPEIQKQYPNIKIVIVSMYQPIDIGLNIGSFKGNGYVLKVSGKEILEDAIKHMQLNKQYIDPNVMQINPVKDPFTNQLKLSKREREIISLIAMGKTSKEIAGLLFLSKLTIKTHRKNISEKLGTKGMADLIAKSFQIGKREI